MSKYGGGGFLQNQGYPATPSSQGSGDNRKDRVTTLGSMSIFQLHSAEKSADDALTVDGKPLGQVIVVGIVREVEVKATKIAVIVEDHTGSIEVTKWIDEESDEGGHADSCREGMYVQVTGNAKFFGGKVALTAHGITKLDSPNRITQHLLETVYTHLRATKGPLDDSGNPMGAPGAPMHGGGTFDAGGGGSASISAGQYGRQEAVQDTGSGMAGANGVVLDLIKTCTDDTGMDVNDMIKQLGGKFSEEKIRETVDWLSAEGHVYSTIDDDHYKSTDQ